jgi:tetratricopeptide (TPR) repeat protein
LENYKKLKELSNAELLRNEGKFLEALEIIKRIEKKEDITPQDQLSIHVLKCTLLNKLGFYEDGLRLAEKTYEEADKLGNLPKLIDVSIEMAEALMFLLRFNESLEVIAKCEKIYNTISAETPIERERVESSIALIKGYIIVDNYMGKQDTERSLEFLKYGLGLQKNLGNKHEISRFYQYIGFNYSVQGDKDLALDYWKKALALEENGFNLQLTWLFYFLGNYYEYKIEWDRALNYYNQGLVLAEKLDSYKLPTAYLSICIADIYHMKGNFDQASIFMEQGLAMYRQISNNDLNLVQPFLTHSLNLAISKKEIKQAEIYLLEIKEIFDRTKNKKAHQIFRQNKALILKASPRFRNKIEAEEILKQLLKEEPNSYIFEMVNLIHLCDLQLTELRVTNELEVLEEIKPYISRLLNIAEKSNSYWFLCETHLIQAKLSLLTFDIQKAKRFLTQAQQIAERFGLNQLALKITNENENLLKKLDLWKNLKEVDAPMIDRLELARLDEHVIGIVQTHSLMADQIMEEKVAIHKEKKTCLVCRAEVLRFSYICECGAMYCENCARALTNLENVCWVCDVPIDYSKPVKPYKEEEERVKVEDKVKNIKKK